jgi:hypothetical protein
MIKKCRCINCLLQGLCRHLRVAARCWGRKQVFTYDSGLQQDEKRTFAFTKTDPVEKNLKCIKIC